MSKNFSKIIYTILQNYQKFNKFFKPYSHKNGVMYTTNYYNDGSLVPSAMICVDPDSIICKNRRVSKSFK